MAKPLKPFIRGGGYYPSRKWTPLVYNGGYTTMDGGEPPTPVYWKTVTGASPLALANALAENIRSLTQFGKCTQASTPAPDAPVDIVCNNGAVRFGALGQNLLNPVGVTIGQNYTPEGEPNSSQNNWRTGLIPIEGGKTYAFWGRRKSDNAISAFNRINWFDADGNNISPRPSYTVDTVTVGTAPSNAAFVGLSCSCYNSSATISQATFDEFNWMLAETDAEIPYEPFVGGIYTDGTPEVLTVGTQTASVVDLLGITDYADTHELVSGAVKRNVGVYVFDGTETFSTSTAYGKSVLLTSASTIWSANKDCTPVCTHFVGTPQRNSGTASEDDCFFNGSGHFYFRVADNDTAAFKTWLAGQYAAGTPVIVLYRLASGGSESVAAHHLNTAAGDNTISVTSNVDPVDLAATYASSEE